MMLEFINGKIQVEDLNHQTLSLWPQAAKELAGFANYLERSASITANQLRLAVQMAQKWYEHEQHSQASQQG